MSLIELKEFNTETIEKIKAFDCEAIKSFYLSNFNLFKKLVNIYINKRLTYNPACDLCFDDFIADIYISLPYYRYDSPDYFIASVKYAFPLVERGGFAYSMEYGLSTHIKLKDLYSLYIENDDGEITLLSDLYDNGKIYDDFTNFSLSYEKMSSKIVEFCSKFFSNKEKIYFQYFMDGYQDKVIREKMCTKSKTHYLTDIKNKLILHFDEVKKFLESNGFVLENRYIILYNELFEKLMKQIERRKERSRNNKEYRKNYYLRNKEKQMQQQRERRKKQKQSNLVT